MNSMRMNWAGRVFAVGLAVGGALTAGSPALGYSYFGEWGELGQSAPVVLASVRSALEGSLCGSEGGFFATPFGGHLHRLPTVFASPCAPDSIFLVPGHSGDIYGVLCGKASSQDCGSKVYMRYGIAGFAVRAQWNALGTYTRVMGEDEGEPIEDSIKPGHRQDQRREGGVLFGSLNYLIKEDLVGSVNVTVGSSYLMSKLPLAYPAVEDDFPLMRTKTEGFDLFADLAVVQHLFAINTLQIGPWVGVSFNRNHLRSFTVRNSEGEAVPMTVSSNGKMPAFSFNTLDVICGVDLKRTFAGKRCVSSIGMKAGWKCRTMQDDSVVVDSNEFCWPFVVRSRDAVVGNVELCRRFDSHWEVLANWSGQFARDSHSNHFSASLAFHF